MWPFWCVCVCDASSKYIGAACCISHFTSIWTRHTKGRLHHMTNCLNAHDLYTSHFFQTTNHFRCKLIYRKNDSNSCIINTSIDYLLFCCYLWLLTYFDALTCLQCPYVTSKRLIQSAAQNLNKLFMSFYGYLMIGSLNNRPVSTKVSL